MSAFSAFPSTSPPAALPQLAALVLRAFHRIDYLMIRLPRIRVHIRLGPIDGRFSCVWTPDSCSTSTSRRTRRRVAPRKRQAHPVTRYPCRRPRTRGVNLRLRGRCERTASFRSDRPSHCTDSIACPSCANGPSGVLQPDGLVRARSWWRRSTTKRQDELTRHSRPAPMHRALRCAAHPTLRNCRALDDRLSSSSSASLSHVP